MDRRERSGSQFEGILAALEGLQAGIWTAFPGIIQSYNPANQTCVVQPAIKAQIQLPDGSFQWVALPLLTECPVCFPAGGGFVLSFPIQPGDECLVIFANRCIDAWWQNGGVQVQAEMRMHDLSDGMVLTGFSSLPRVTPGLSTNSVQLRNTSGSTKIELDASGNINITGTLVINGVPYLAHQHTGVVSGGSNTGGVA